MHRYKPSFIWKPAIGLLAALLLMGQQGGCATTPESRADRCKSYQSGLAAAQLLTDDVERAERVRFYSELIETWCAK